MRIFPFILLVSCVSLARAQVIGPDYDITLNKIDPATGAIKWSVPFLRNQLPYRSEAYPGKIVVYLDLPPSPTDKEHKTEVLFLDSETGKPVMPFDTRRFVNVNEDAQIARSIDGLPGPELDFRSELNLPNGWISRGAGLCACPPDAGKIYFFNQTSGELQWTFTLPGNATHLSHWDNTLLFQKSEKKEGKTVDALYAQPAGKDAPIWEFVLPSVVPDAINRGPADVAGSPTTVRQFSYYVGKKEIFVIGNGFLFALDPATGKILWQCDLTADPLLKKENIHLQGADMLESGNDLLLVSDLLIRFSKTSRSASAVLRKDMYSQYGQFLAGGYLYCYTAKTYKRP
jgi:outer membrane protein assembly factor BamB